MDFKETNLKGLFEIDLKPFEDERGFFVRVYDDKLFENQSLKRFWVQENISFSMKKGTFRGLHFQRSPYAETKLVSVFRGEVFFAVVDLRKNSPTFGKWWGITLSEKNKKMFFVEKGFAIGMYTLTDNCLLHYKMDNYYSPEYAETIKWNDADLNIAWPTKEPAVISEKDKSAGSFKEFIKKHGGI